MTRERLRGEWKMDMRRARKNFRLRSFTLVEIMVALAILLVVAVIMIFAVTGLTDKSRVSITQSRMRLLAEAITAFKSTTGYFPLAVPEDAWTSARDWDHIDPTPPYDGDDFAAVMYGHENVARWHTYFVPNTATNTPRHNWVNVNPTNIQMLAFQLEQVPEASKIFDQLKEKNAVAVQKALDPPGTPAVEKWIDAPDSCRLYHPLDPATADPRQVYQAQDAWGLPLRFWTGDVLKWAKNNTAASKNAWDTNVLNLLSTKLQQANWGFFIESVGKNGRFGWWGASGATLNTRQAADNIYSTDR